ncbi:hypothetical protein C5167_024100 [Papaver somniferum]|uniref:Uncharacterized protein n=1 Tax=Papaver somniferum TaxID=3469 RepID=A0A4Y7JQN4_PAPSO|nr:hypothetical protein C5167_024100 [Papaver somniferum]
MQTLDSAAVCGILHSVIGRWPLLILGVDLASVVSPGGFPISNSNRFTRVSGELSGLLIAMLFAQQVIRGVVDDFIFFLLS